VLRDDRKEISHKIGLLLPTPTKEQKKVVDRAVRDMLNAIYPVIQSLLHLCAVQHSSKPLEVGVSPERPQGVDDSSHNTHEVIRCLLHRWIVSSIDGLCPDQANTDMIHENEFSAHPDAFKDIYGFSHSESSEPYGSDYGTDSDGD
jgi:hypothetical protein